MFSSSTCLRKRRTISLSRDNKSWWNFGWIFFLSHFLFNFERSHCSRPFPHFCASVTLLETTKGASSKSDQRSLFTNLKIRAHSEHRKEYTHRQVAMVVENFKSLRQQPITIIALICWYRLVSRHLVSWSVACRCVNGCRQRPLKGRGANTISG